MSDIGFAQNWTNLFFINITPDAAKTWARIGAGISTTDPNGNEVVDDSNYYDGEGVADSEVTGGQPVISFTGHRKYGDAAQDWIASKRLAYGSARRTDFMQIGPDGTKLEGKCTIANIKDQGGDANSKSDFSFNVRMNGRPSLTPGNKTEYPEQITCEAITISDVTPVTPEVTITPEDASDSLVYAIEDDSIAKVDAMGTITPVKNGSTKLNIKSAVLPTVQCTVEVTVSGVQANSIETASLKSAGATAGSDK